MTSSLAPVRPSTLTPQRIAASSAALLALMCAILAAVALARSIRRVGAGGRRGARIALVLAPIATLVGAVIIATADGGFGTGQGLAGGIVAVCLGVIGMALAGTTLARSRRHG